MSGNFTRPQPSVDVKIEEIPLGQHKVKVVGTVVSMSSLRIIINDGTGQIDLELGKVSDDEIEVQQLGRFVCDVIKSQDGQISGRLLACTKITSEQAKRYRRLIKLERRLPK